MNTNIELRRLGCERVRGLVVQIVLGVVMSGVLASPCWAGEQAVPCAEPYVWSGAAVNAVIHPYQYTGRDYRPLSETARQLTLLTHMNVLFSMLKYGGVGAVTITTRGVSPDKIRFECSPEDVMRKILGQEYGARSEIKRHRGVVMLSGFVYDEGGDVYVQSFVRFLRRQDPGRITLDLGSAETGASVLVGSFAYQAIAFAPRKLSRQTLQEIATAFFSTARIHEEPDETSPAYDVVVDPDVPLSYRVNHAQGGWMEISSPEIGVDGWIKAEPAVGGRRLDQQLPEIHFIEGLVGYMRYQMALDGTVEYGRPDRILGWTRRAFARFEEQAGGGASPEAAAAARILLGNLEILAAGPDNLQESVQSAARYYAKAVKITPYSAVARNMDSMARIYLGQRTGWIGESPSDVATSLQQALALDTGNQDITANLEALFTVMGDLPESVTKIDGEQLEKKMAAVKRVRAHQAER